MTPFTKGQPIVYMRNATQLHPASNIEATYCSEYSIGKWRRHHISLVEDGKLVHRYVSIGAIRAVPRGSEP